MVEEILLTKKGRLEKEIGRIKKELARSPKGTIVASKVHGKYRWYHQKKCENGFKRFYLGNEDKELTEKLARKAYYEKMIRDMENELGSIKRYLKYRKPVNYGNMLRNDSPYWELLLRNRWDGEEYERNPSHPERLIVKAPKGEFVRSKSEALIANALFDFGIQYRYECRMDLEENTYYPDFTIRPDVTDRTVIWEHFGKLDEPEYYYKMMRKIDDYINHGYLPGENFFMTFETKARPLSIDDVHRVMMQVLL